MDEINIFTFILSFFLPQFVELILSPINGPIIVDIFHGKYRISAKGYWQTGEYAKHVMEVSLSDLRDPNKTTKEILLLGLGGGSALSTIHNTYPLAHITAIDIDPVMIALGKKYFNLSKETKTEMVVQDAYTYVKAYKGIRFDMVLADLFVGCEVPATAESSDFLKQVYRITGPKGVYICNRSYLKKYKKKTDIFEKRVRSLFGTVEKLNREPNAIIRAYKSVSS